MNREILFRGKRVDNEEWIYGSLVTGAFVKSSTGQDIPYIFNTDECDTADCFEDFTDDYGYYEVDPSTVGQYTGLTDSKGNRVFEGDIVKCWDDAADDVNWGLDNHHTGRIEYSGTCFSLAVKSRFPKSISNAASRHEIDGDYPNTITYLDRWVNAENIEVLSNRFDNPELIKQS